MVSYSTNDEKFALDELRDGSNDAYMLIYCRFQPILYTHLYRKLGDREEVMDIIQDVFANLWQRRSSLEIGTNLGAYLFSAARYEVIKRFDRAETAKRYRDSVVHYASGYVASTDHRCVLNAIRLTGIKRGNIDHRQISIF